MRYLQPQFMDFIVYILVYPLIWLTSILPFRILYIISDFLYLIVYYVIGYRKKVVLSNLKIALPDKTEKELLVIRKKFYHHFVDIFMEMIKSFTISEKEINRRYKYTNLELLNNLYENGKSVAIVGGHYANWEWVLNLNSFVKYNCVGAYTRVSNKYLNNQILKSRGKFGVQLVPTSKTIPVLIENHKNKVQSLYGLLSDQSPQLKKTFYWGEFFGVKVPIHTGAEMLAKKYDMNIIFINVKKVKRGFYETTFSLITDNAKKYANYELTDIFIDLIEKQIQAEPAYYFWTHKRFKHKDKAPK